MTEFVTLTMLNEGARPSEITIRVGAIISLELRLGETEVSMVDGSSCCVAESPESILARIAEQNAPATRP